MANLETYDGLKEVIADYLGRDDLTERIPTFIRLAEKRMDRDIRCRLMERNGYADVESGQKGIELPCKRVDGEWDVFVEMRSIAWKGNKSDCVVLEYITPEQYMSRSSSTGTVTHYTIIRDNVYWVNVPDTDGRILLTYYAEIPPLSAKQQCNPVLHVAPDLYLYASLLESVPFTRGSVPAQEWMTAYQEAVAKLTRQEQHARFTATLKMRPIRGI